MMNMIFEDIAPGAGIGVDLPPADPEWGEGGSFRDSIDSYGGVSSLPWDWWPDTDPRPGALL